MIQSNKGTLKIHATSMDQTLWLPLTGNPCSNKTTAKSVYALPSQGEMDTRHGGYTKRNRQEKHMYDRKYHN